MSDDSVAYPDDDLKRAVAEEIARSRVRSSAPSRRRTSRIANTSQSEQNYHLARMLLLIGEFSSKKSSLRGLTKLAKLDFLLRYPVFLERISMTGIVPGLHLPEDALPSPDEREAVESRMIRYKYGPWDDKYYGLVGALVGRGLAEYSDDQRGQLALRLTPAGRQIASVLANDPSWAVTSARCKILRQAFSRTSGNRLKELIYAQLPDAVDRPHRTEI